jgi:hypothetical protein
MRSDQIVVGLLGQGGFSLRYRIAQAVVSHGPLLSKPFGPSARHGLKLPHGDRLHQQRLAAG